MRTWHEQSQHFHEAWSPYPRCTSCWTLLLPRDRGLVLCLVYIGTPLAYIPPGVFFVGRSLDLEQSGVLVLVPLSTLVSSEHCLGVKTTGWRSHFCLSCRSESSNKGCRQRGEEERSGIRQHSDGGK